MDFEKYNIKPEEATYPRRDDYFRYTLYRKGAVLCAEASISEVSATVPELSEASTRSELERACTKHGILFEQDILNEEYRAAVSAYNQITAEKGEQFRKDLFEEFGVTGHPQADIVYRKAWDHGHSAGYSEVYNVFADLVEIITLDPRETKNNRDTTPGMGF